jgi:FtsZ-binding cell division protein ZapB
MSVDELTKVTESVKTAHHRLDTLEKQVEEIRTLAASLEGTERDVKHLRDDVREIKEDVKSVISRPAKQWDKLVAAVIAAIGSALAGAALALLQK